MQATTKPLLALTARDLMSRDLVLLKPETSLREAAHLLVQNRISGAPVVDSRGKCLGVLSATDFVVRSGEQPWMDASPPRLPIACPYQEKGMDRNWKQITTCALPPGACAIQVKQKASDGQDVMVCSEPHGVCTGWQVVELEEIPADNVGRYMTADPVTVSPDLSIRDLAELMIDAHIHRVVVTNDRQQPVGIVSSTDLLAAVAYAGPWQ